MNLTRIGWDEERQKYLEDNHPGLEPARVAIEHGPSYLLLTSRGEVSGVTTGRMKHDTVLRVDLPVVGDWVAARPLPGEDKVVVEALLPRRSAFSRDVAGRTTEEQVLAANVDKLFVVSGLDGD